MQLDKRQILDIVNTQLLFWIKKDATVKEAVLELVQTKYLPKKETESRFDKLLKELSDDREEQNCKWEENQRDQNKRWEEQNRKWEEQNKKWEENQRTINKILEEIRTTGKRHEQSMGAIGTRWGLHSEASFRNALKGILGKINSEYEVIHYNEFDHDGIVFDEPADVEIDVIVKNGIAYLTEIKSSVNESDVFVFLRKIKYYQKHHKQKTLQGIIISPMISEKAETYAKKSGLILYSYADDVVL